MTGWRQDLRVIAISKCGEFMRCAEWSEGGVW